MYHDTLAGMATQPGANVADEIHLGLFALNLTPVS